MGRLMSLQDQTILITGATGAIGQAMARAVVAEGARVVIHYGRNRDAAEARWPIWAGAAGACLPICQTRKARGRCGRPPWGWPGGSPGW